MNRKQFIMSHGATCRNWYWSWSFINEEQRIIIFGAWDTFKQSDGSTLILSKSWEYDHNDNKSKSYRQSREHIRLIQEEGYKLKTFPIEYSDDYKDKEGNGPAKIKSFGCTLTDKILKQHDDGWYAYDSELGNFLPEEIDTPQKYYEGASKEISVNAYERNPDARAKCVEHHGYKCLVCSFDFESVYGDIGKNYIHVHHVKPLSQIRKEYEIDPIRDLIPVCPNCHAMIHKTKPALSVKELKKRLSKKI